MRELSAAVALLKSLSAFLAVHRENFGNYCKKTLDTMTAIDDAACERNLARSDEPVDQDVYMMTVCSQQSF